MELRIGSLYYFYVEDVFPGKKIPKKYQRKGGKNRHSYCICGYYLKDDPGGKAVLVDCFWWTGDVYDDLGIAEIPVDKRDKLRIPPQGLKSTYFAQRRARWDLTIYSSLVEDRTSEEDEEHKQQAIEELGATKKWLLMM